MRVISLADKARREYNLVYRTLRAMSVLSPPRAGTFNAKESAFALSSNVYLRGGSELVFT